MGARHFYDGCDGGICLSCDRCLRETCCLQTEECDGQNWNFINRTPEEWLEWYREKGITFDSELFNYE